MPPPLDVTGFDIQVEIVTTNGDRFPLWMSPGPDVVSADTVFGGEGGGLGDLAIVESVELNISRGATISTNINICAPYEQGRRLLNSDLFVIGNVYEVRIGYPRVGRFMPWATFQSRMPSIRITGDEGLTATLVGTGGGFAAMRGASSQQFTGSYRQTLLEIAAREHNYWLTDLPNLDPNSPLDQDREPYGQSNQSEWYFIQRLVRSANCDAYLRPSRREEGRTTLVVERRQEVFEQDVRFTFVMRGRVDFINFFPLLSFESAAEGIWAPRASNGVECTDVNPRSGDVETVTATVDTSEVPRTEQSVPGGEGNLRVGDHRVALHPTRQGDTDTGERLVCSSRDPRGPAQVARSRLEEASVNGAIQATITSFAIPELFPGDLIRLLNLGPFDGRYVINTMQHRAAAGEWTVTMSLLSNAVRTGFVARGLQTTPPNINSNEGEDISDQSDTATSSGTTEREAEPET